MTSLLSKSMASTDQYQLHVINQIADELSSDEREKLFYLCGSWDTDNSVVCLKEMLKCKVMCHETGNLLLRELMLELRRFDILRKVCKTSRDEVERTLMNKQILPRFRVLMSNISEDMASEDLNSVKFLLSGTLSREKIERAKSFLAMIIELEKMDLISPQKVDFVEECLRNIDRVDLSKKVTAYKMSVGTAAQQQRCKAPQPLALAIGSRPLLPTRQGHSATETIPVSVYREQTFQSQLDMYQCNTNPRGLCVIIDCVGNDGDMLKQTFKALHFNVVLHKWLSADDTFSALRATFRQRENLECDRFVCCIISRGTTNYLMGTDSYGEGLHLDYVRRLFNAESCPMLAGKPKLFFIQRYNFSKFQLPARMGHRDEDLETDGYQGLPSRDVIPKDADVFWSHCWTDDGQLEQGNHRSFYLQALTDALHRGQRRKTHLVDVHTEVNGAIFEHNKRNPGAKYHIEVRHTLRKNLYLQ